MIDKSVAKRYAQALFGAAEKAGRADPVLRDLESVEKLIERDSSLLRFLSSPQELDERKEALVEKLFGDRADPLIVRLFLLLLRKGRILHLRDVIAAYRALLEEERGIVAARVVSAVALSDEENRRLRDELRRISEKEIRIEAVVDPKIIGGLVVMMEGRIYDRSVRHELERLREELFAVRVH
ncbi:MAG: ATP synthase F1 subunit delta [Candidatus Eisenbacteria bacterium]|nr:ATP synthase F1 subunit delta [Candidatus Latescibacterota bacterium]MBD3301493.1 ATP synthase F1 subunit delta [Candidatus Eisenbacteria bacterium]